MALGPKVVNTLAAAFSKFVEKSEGALRNLVYIPLKALLDLIGGEAKQPASPIIQEILDIPDLPPKLRTFFEDYKNHEGEFGAIWGTVVDGLTTIAAMLATLRPLMLQGTYKANTWSPVEIPAPGELIEMLNRGLMGQRAFEKDIAQHGFTVPWPNLMAAIREARPTYEDLRDLERRGDLLPGKYDEGLKRLGFSDDNIARLKKLNLALPPAPDLVRFELREVWRPEFRPGLLVPPTSGKFKQEMAKLGYSSETADDYWAAHWDLPSVGQGFEMFHRIPAFTETDLRTLMRRLDILQEYHDNLIAIAYNPFTRVDVRRMFRVGVLNREQVKRAYLDIGYDETKAEAMTEFTVKYETETTRDLTRTDIEDGYKRGVLSRSEAVDALVDIGYDEDEAEYYLAKVETKKEEEKADPYISRYKKLYVYGLISRDDARARLAALGILADAITEYLELWDLDREARVSDSAEVKERDLTRADITGGYRDGIIPRDEASAYLQSLGYDPGEAEFYLSREDFNLAKDTRELTVATYRKLYTEGILDKTATTGALVDMGFEQGEITLLYALWDIEREGTARTPTRADLVRFTKKGIITQERYSQELQQMGYLTEAVQWYMEDLKE
uniref:Putative RuvA domain containing protein n=1 Tax=viral metagenome TaxID=1070528 RepID=A0A6H1ZZ89_9ZZZZ